MDKLDDPRKKRLEELLQQARGGGTAPASSGTAAGSSARPSSIPSPRVSCRLWLSFHSTASKLWKL